MSYRSTFHLSFWLDVLKLELDCPFPGARASGSRFFVQQKGAVMLRSVLGYGLLPILYLQSVIQKNGIGNYF